MNKLSVGMVVRYQPLNISGIITKVYSFDESCSVFFAEKKMELGVLSRHLIEIKSDGDGKRIAFEKIK